MKKRIIKTCWTVFILAALLLLMAPQALADGAAAITDEVTVNESGAVILTSSHMAGEGVSSLQLRLDATEAGGTASFSFDGGLGDRLTKCSNKEGVLYIYIAGTAPLMTGGQTQLTLGTVSGVSEPEKVKLADNSLEFVYGTRMILQAFQEEDGGIDSNIRDGLELLIDSTAEFAEKGEYTTETWDALQAAISHANELLGRGESVTLEELNEAYNALEDAIAALTPAGRALLEKAVAEAKAVDASAYTSASYAALQAAVREAEAALAGSEEEDWAAMEQSVRNAINALVPLSPGSGGGVIYPDGNDSGRSGDVDPTDAPGNGQSAADTAGGRAPNTGDVANVHLWVLMLCLCSSLLTALVRRRNRCGR